jgi:hypothetical protein
LQDSSNIKGKFVNLVVDKKNSKKKKQNFVSKNENYLECLVFKTKVIWFMVYKMRHRGVN